MYSVHTVDQRRNDAGWRGERAIICESADHLHDKSAGTRGLRAATDTEVSVLPEKTRVLFVDTNDILDHEGCTIVFYERAGL